MELEKKDKKRRVNIYIDQDHYEKLVGMANKSKRTTYAEFIRKAIDLYLSENTNKAGNGI